MANFRQLIERARERVNAVVDNARASVNKVVDRAAEVVRSFLPFDTQTPEDEQIEQEVVQGLEVIEESRADALTAIDFAADEANIGFDAEYEEMSAEYEFVETLVNGLSVSREIAEALWNDRVLDIGSRTKNMRRQPFASLEDLYAYYTQPGFPSRYATGFFYDGNFFYLEVDEGQA